MFRSSRGGHLTWFRESRVACEVKKICLRRTAPFVRIPPLSGFRLSGFHSLIVRVFPVFCASPYNVVTRRGANNAKELRALMNLTDLNSSIFVEAIALISKSMKLLSRSRDQAGLALHISGTQWYIACGYETKHPKVIHAGPVGEGLRPVTGAVVVKKGRNRCCLRRWRNPQGRSHCQRGDRRWPGRQDCQASGPSWHTSNVSTTAQLSER